MKVILVPHPGPERTPAHGVNQVQWPAHGEPHRRKFMRHEGECVQQGNRVRRELSFWCEYEGPTTAIPVEPTIHGGPSRIQTIHPAPGGSVGRMNTDPWIFSRGFIWTVCRHNAITEPLAAGDIVLFGSVLEGNWCLDTVLVVCCRGAHAHSEMVTPEYLYMVRSTLPDPLQPVFGRSFQSHDQPFSFVPGSTGRPFARPSINHILEHLRKRDGSPPAVNNAQALTYTTPRANYAIWPALVQSVEAQELVLGFDFTLSLRIPPSRTPSPDVLIEKCCDSDNIGHGAHTGTCSKSAACKREGCSPKPGARVGCRR
jgi:hypothetical protein